MKASRSGSTLLLAAGLLAGCGSDSQVGGGGGIEIPNGLNLTVNASDNQPASGVAVRVLARESWLQRTLLGGSVVLDSGVTDDQGRASLQVPTGEGYWVEATRGSQGVRLEGSGTDPQSVVLASLSRLSGVVTDSPRAGIRVRLAGTSRTTLTDAQGRFQFDGLPQSGYSLVSQDEGTRTLSRLGKAQLGGQSLDVAVNLPAPGTLVLDDFADGDNVWALRDLFGTAYWWLAASGEAGVKGAFGVDGVWKAMQSDGSGNHWIGAVLDGTSLGSSPWAGVGLDMGPSTGWLPDLSKATALRIRVRGRGIWNLNLIEKRGTTEVTWASPVSLDTIWTEIRIPTADLQSTAGPSETWGSQERVIRQILLQTSAGGQLDLGELAVEGTSLADWAK